MTDSIVIWYDANTTRNNMRIKENFDATLSSDEILLHNKVFFIIY